VRFSISTAFLPTDQLVPIARAADELGYDSLAIPDHVVDLETLSTPYPYTPDGARRWSSDAEWPDPWVLAGALSTVTTRLRFFTSVYVLGQEFRTRGRRTDEGLALIQELWQPGWREFHGDFYDTPRLTMEPTPSAPVPIYVGGLSDAAFARAARHDGWVGDMYKTDEAVGWAARLAEARAAIGATGDFAVFVALTDAFLPEHFVRAEEGGVTDCMTMPWMYYSGADASLEEKLDGMARFADDVIVPCSM
jgi:alkanesulfonate monooxygenase SsuD/methylene tetrahydromethanopterin reductase-like flavin-dependent oxidoreductase (luciferase family)